MTEYIIREYAEGSSKPKKEYDIEAGDPKEAVRKLARGRMLTDETELEVIPENHLHTFTSGDADEIFG